MTSGLGSNKQGMALIITIGMLMVVVILANIIVSLMFSHTRLSHHQISRIQAYYAAMAGVNFALEQLRTGQWQVNSCPAGQPPACSITFNAGDFQPPSIVGNQVSIVITPAQSANPADACYNPPGNSACVSATVDYTFSL